MILIPGTLDQLLQKFIVSANVPFRIIENPVLKEIIGRGFPKQKNYVSTYSNENN